VKLGKFICEVDRERHCYDGTLFSKLSEGVVCRQGACTNRFDADDDMKNLLDDGDNFLKSNCWSYRRPKSALYQLELSPTA
jgi:hypothetical protein